MSPERLFLIGLLLGALLGSAIVALLEGLTRRALPRPARRPAPCGCPRAMSLQVLEQEEWSTTRRAWLSRAAHPRSHSPEEFS